MQPLIVKNLTIAYRKRIIIDDFSHSFNAGSYAIIGANGCGKTSLLKTLAGILPVANDRILLKGLDIRSNAIAVKQQLSYVPDEPYVYPFMTGKDLLSLVATIKKSGINKNIEEKIQSFKIESFMDKEFRQLSFGTQRKFTIVAAMIGEPSVLLLDEPMNGLDANAKLILTDYLNEIRETTVILFTSHDTTLKKSTNAEEIALEL